MLLIIYIGCLYLICGVASTILWLSLNKRVSLKDKLSFLDIVMAIVFWPVLLLVLKDVHWKD